MRLGEVVGGTRFDNWKKIASANAPAAIFFCFSWTSPIKVLNAFFLLSIREKRKSERKKKEK